MMPSLERLTLGSDQLRISILIHNIYGVGGTNRAVINLAEALTRRGHDVEIVSVFRRLDEPMWRIDPLVTITPLVDTRPGSPDRTDPQQWQRSSIVPPHEEFYSVYSQQTDDRLRRYLSSGDRDVYIGSRPALNLAVAAWAPRRSIRVAQEHQTHDTIPENVRRAMQTAYVTLDAAVTVTRADAASFRSNTPVAGLTIDSIPNSVPAADLPPSALDTNLIVAVGRLDPVKRYDLLLRAFARVTDDAPDWQLRIYGGGAESGRLRGLITNLRLNDRVLLMGRRADIEEEWIKASMCVSMSERESFGMSIVEAMRSGVPTISTRAPVGPEEILTDREDGLLIPVGDVDAAAASMAELINDHVLREQLGRRALENSARYDPDAVAEQYEALLYRLRRQARRSPIMLRHARVRLRAAMGDARRRATSSERRRIEPASRVSCRVTVRAGGVALLDVRANVGSSDDVTLRIRNAADRKLTDVPLRPHPDRTGFSGVINAAELPEARWIVLAAAAGGRLTPVDYEPADLRSVIRIESSNRTPFCHLLPYRNQNGFLSIRSWVRPDHAECAHIELNESGHVVLSGTAVWGTGVSPVEQVYAIRRQGKGERVIGELLAGDGSGRFRAALDVDDLSRLRLTRRDSWDVYVRSSSGSTARLAKLADDIPDRKSVYAFPQMGCVEQPSVWIEESPEPIVGARPYLTADSGVSILVVEEG